MHSVKTKKSRCYFSATGSSKKAEIIVQHYQQSDIHILATLLRYKMVK